MSQAIPQILLSASWNGALLSRRARQVDSAEWRIRRKLHTWASIRHCRYGSRRIQGLLCESIPLKDKFSGDLICLAFHLDSRPPTLERLRKLIELDNQFDGIRFEKNSGQELGKLPCGLAGKDLRPSRVPDCEPDLFECKLIPISVLDSETNGADEGLKAALE